MDKKDMIQKLKDEGCIYGKKYTVQGMYSWEHDKGGNIREEVELVRYDVCEMKEILIEDRSEMLPISIECFEIEDIEKAIERFIEFESTVVQ